MPGSNSIARTSRHYRIPLTHATAAALGVSLLLLAAMTGAGEGSSHASSVARAIEMVSSDRMMDTVRHLQGFGSRAFYLNSSMEAAEYIFERFSELGLDVHYQYFMAGPHRTANVVAVLNGSSSEGGEYLLGAHYDSENSEATNYSLGSTLSAPGADDDASGVAAVLEIATVLSGQTVSNTVKFVAFGAEERGYDGSGMLNGSRHFVKAEKANGTVFAGTVILDMIGYSGGRGIHAAAAVNENSMPMAARIGDATERYNLNLSFSTHFTPNFAASDNYPFWTGGYPSVLVIEDIPSAGAAEMNPCYHTANDTADTLSAEQMTEVTRGVLAAVLELTTPSTNDDHVVVLGVLVAAIAVTSIIYVFLRKWKVGKT